MPAARLPWFRFWVGATAHEKVRQLDDGTFRTWVEMLDAAASQPVRGRFVSRRGAAAVIRRPVKHIATLIEAGLVDEDAAQRLTMHDWDWWQRWRKEDANDTPSPTESPPDEHANNTRTPTRSTRDDPVPLREKESEKEIEKRDVDGDVDEERDEDTPPATQVPPKGGTRRQRVTEVTGEFKDDLEERFWEQMGSREAVRDVMNDAMGHAAGKKHGDQQAYLRNWVRGEAEKSAARRRVPARRPTMPVVIGAAAPAQCVRRCGRTVAAGGSSFCRECREEESLEIEAWRRKSSEAKVTAFVEISPGKHMPRAREAGGAV